jgi:hypothetical protein
LDYRLHLSLLSQETGPIVSPQPTRTTTSIRSIHVTCALFALPLCIATGESSNLSQCLTSARIFLSARQADSTQDLISEHHMRRKRAPGFLPTIAILPNMHCTTSFFNFLCFLSVQPCCVNNAFYQIVISWVREVGRAEEGMLVKV